MAIETKKPAQIAAGPGEDSQTRSDSSGVPDAGGEWNAFVDQHAYGHLLQTDAWGALKCRFGWTSSRVQVEAHPDVAFTPAGAWIGGAEILYRCAYGLTLAYIPRGPVVDWENPEHVTRVLHAAEEDARAQGAAVLKLEPPVLDSLAARALLRDRGYAPSLQTVQPPSTIRIDLRADETTILQRMKSKWRYNVRLAARKAVTVRAATVEDLPIFNDLMAVTGARDGFHVHSPDYYAAAFELLTPRHGVFLLAEFEGQPLGAIVVAHCGDSALYLWGASNNEERNRMPNHALQWAGMQWAKARGAAWYDLWGVPDAIGLLALGLKRGIECRIPVEDLPVDMDQLPGHDLWGVYRFKQGFGGEAVRYVGAWDKPLSPVKGRIYTLGLQARETVKTLQSAREAGRMRATIGELATLSMANGKRLLADFRKARERTDTQSPSAQSPITQLPTTDAQSWRATLRRFSAPHVLQSWEWGQIKAQTGWTAHRFVFSASPDSAATAAFQLLRRRFVPGLPWSVGYIPKGPAADWDTLGDPAALLAAVEDTARGLGCIFVKIDPDVREDTPFGRALLAALRRRGWRYSPNQIQFKNTAYTDFSQLAGEGGELETQAVEAALQAQMKSKWRYNIRLAQRRGIRVRAGSVVDLPLFYGLYAETGARDGFLVRPYGYYLETWRTFLQAEQDEANPAGGALLLAEHADDREPVAGLFLMRYGQRAWYFYGASSDRRRRDMPNHLLQWEAMRWALARGCTVYDWWGAPDNVDDAQDSMHGVWQFKQGFGAAFQSHIGAWDFPVHPRAYALFTEALPKALSLLRRL